MTNEDVFVLIKAPVIFNLKCVPSLQCLLICIVTAPNYAARLVKLEFPIVMITAVKCTYFSVCFFLSHPIVKLTDNFFSRTVLINQAYFTHFQGVIKKGLDNVSRLGVAFFVLKSN